MKKLLAALTLTAVAAQAVAGYAPQSAEGAPSDPKATPAYAVLVLRKAAVEAELAHLSGVFTSQHPSVENKRAELAAVSREMEKLLVIGRSLAARLSSAYGKLILRKVALEVELKGLLRSFTPQHPEVNKKRVEVTALEREMERLLQ